jgi:hypothetical protein
MEEEIKGLDTFKEDVFIGSLAGLTVDEINKNKKGGADVPPIDWEEGTAPPEPAPKKRGRPPGSKKKSIAATPMEAPLDPKVIKDVVERIDKKMAENKEPQAPGLNWNFFGSDNTDIDTTTDEGAKKYSLFKKISAYYKHFPNLQASAPKRITLRDSLSILQEEFMRIQMELSDNQALANAKSADILLHAALERVLCTLGVPAMGLQKVGKECQDDMDQEIKELSIKYMHIFASGPEIRYLLTLMRRIHYVVNYNTGKETAIGSSVVSEDALNKMASSF